MTSYEKNALNLHNNIFTKRAIKLVTLSEPYRFKVIYNDGSEKYDYSCGSSSNKIRDRLLT